MAQSCILLRHSASGSAVLSSAWENPKPPPSQERLQLREGHLDGVEDGTVERSVEQRRAGRLDQL
jgi:hypothetical protein